MTFTVIPMSLVECAGFSRQGRRSPAAVLMLSLTTEPTRLEFNLELGSESRLD